MAQVKLQARTVGEVTAFLGKIAGAGGTMLSLGCAVSATTKTVVKNHGLATVEGRGLGAKWTLTETGRTYLAGTKTAA